MVLVVEMKTISVIKKEYLNLLEECNDIDTYQERATKSFNGLRDSIIDDIKEMKAERLSFDIPEEDKLYDDYCAIIGYLMEKFEIGEDELK